MLGRDGCLVAIGKGAGVLFGFRQAKLNLRSFVLLC